MLPARVASVPFTVIDAKGAVVYRGVSRDDVGAWNSRYKAVYLLSFSGLSGAERTGCGSAAAVSPAFKIANGTALYGKLVDNAVRYFTSERDGADVEHSVLSRKPANLTDAKADVYSAPDYDDNDNLVGTLKRVGGPVNVSGGWFDAGGGYEKFGYTASYTDALMLIAARDNRNAYPTLKPEAEFGLQWMTKLWNPNQKVLYMQVGIGNGNASNTIQGDYNFWFLPQREDLLDVAKGGNPGPTAYYVKYRPVFEAAAPGQKVSPNLAGRYAADFALGAQLARGATARHLLSLARSVYADAKTTNVGTLVTAYPNDYYPGTEWKSDMLWGATEIALADERLGVPRAQLRADLAVAARWARAYIAQGHPAGSDTLNLYDTGAIAEAELLQRDARVRYGARDRAQAARQRHGQAAAGRRGVGQGRPVRARHRPRARPTRRRTRSGSRSPTSSTAGRRLGPLPGVRAAAAQLRPRRERVGVLVRGRRGHHVPALHAERDRQPGGLAHRPRGHPARRGHRRAEQPRQLRRARHASAACARARPGRSPPSTSEGGRLRGQRAVVAVGRAGRRLHRDLAVRVRDGGVVRA